VISIGNLHLKSHFNLLIELQIKLSMLKGIFLFRKYITITRTEHTKYKTKYLEKKLENIFVYNTLNLY